MNKFVISKLTKDYLEESIALFKDVFTKAPWFDKYINDDIVPNIFKSFMENNSFVGFVLVEESTKKIVGLSIGYDKAYLGGFEYYIDQFCIETSLQAKGVGGFFLDEIIKELQKTNMNAIYLNTDRGFPAEKFYKKHGFKEDKNIVYFYKSIK